MSRIAVPTVGRTVSTSSVWHGRTPSCSTLSTRSVVIALGLYPHERRILVKETDTAETNADHSDLDDQETDWDALEAMTDEEVQKAAESDPDAQPMTEEQLRGARRAPNVKAIRERFGLSQSEFATRFGFSTRTIQEWEQGRSFPNRGYMLYLWTIEDGFAVPNAVPKTAEQVPDTASQARVLRMLATVEDMPKVELEAAI